MLWVSMFVHASLAAVAAGGALSLNRECHDWNGTDSGRDPETETNLTTKLMIDSSCFVAGVILALSRLLWRFLQSIWGKGCMQCREDCGNFCGEHWKRSRECFQRACRRCLSQARCRSRLNLSLQAPLIERRESGSKELDNTFLRRVGVLLSVEGKPTACKNYFRYLWTCCGMLFVLFLVSCGIDAVFQVSEIGTVEDSGDFVADQILHSSIFDDITKHNARAIFGRTLSVVCINGLIFLGFTFFLERCCVQPALNPMVNRTIWVHGVPVTDQRLNPFNRQRFRLTPDELKNVEFEIGNRMNAELNMRRERNADRERKVKRNKINRRESMVRPLAREDAADDGEWVVDEYDAHLRFHERQEPSPGWSVGNHVGARGIFRDAKGRAVFVRKVQKGSSVENVWVTPVVKTWCSVSAQLEMTSEQQRTYHTWVLAYQHPARTGVRDSMWCYWYKLWSRRYEAKVKELEAQLLRVRLDKLCMCGSAFVLFRDEAHCEDLLGPAPSWWNCKDWLCLFNSLNFGHVPFTSVTLEYEPAPHPADIRWENMDTPRWWSESVFVVLTLLLLVFLVAGQAIVVWILGFGGQLGQRVQTHFASLLLLFVNRLALPFPIAWIALAGKFRRRTEAELRQMHLNFMLLLINTIVVPLLGVQIAQQIPPELTHHPLSFMRCISFSLLELPRRFFVGYLFDVTFLTNLNMVISSVLFEVLNFLQRTLTASLPPGQKKPAAPKAPEEPPAAEEPLAPELAGSEGCVSPGGLGAPEGVVLEGPSAPEGQAAPEGLAAPEGPTGQQEPAKELSRKSTPPEYSFGYYYAWTLSIMAVALVTSVEVPWTLFVAGLCFFTKTVVDGCNVHNEVYSIGPEHEGVYVTWTIFYLRLCLSGWWLTMSIGLSQLCKDPDVESACPRWTQPCCEALSWSAVAVIAGSLFRTSHAFSRRRFFPGRQEHKEVNPTAELQEEELSWDATPKQQRWTAKDSFAAVEEIVDIVAQRPEKRASVQMYLAQELSVHEILRKLGKRFDSDPVWATPRG